MTRVITSAQFMARMVDACVQSAAYLMTSILTRFPSPSPRPPSPRSEPSLDGGNVRTALQLALRESDRRRNVSAEHPRGKKYQNPSPLPPSPKGKLRSANMDSMPVFRVLIVGGRQFQRCKPSPGSRRCRMSVVVVVRRGEGMTMIPVNSVKNRNEREWRPEHSRSRRKCGINIGR